MVAHPLRREIREVQSLQRRDDICQLASAVGQPRVPAQCPAGRDERDEIAVPHLTRDERRDRRPCPIPLLLREVHIVEEQDEGAARSRVDADVGRIVEAARLGPGSHAVRRRSADGLEQLDGLRLAFVADFKVGCREIGDRLALAIDDHCIDDDEVGSGAEGRWLRRLLPRKPDGEHDRTRAPSMAIASTRQPVPAACSP